MLTWGWFPYDRRRSQIYCRWSQRQLFPYNGGRSRSRLLPRFRSAEVSQLQAPCAGKAKCRTNLCLMVCVQRVDWAIPDFESLLALHLAPIQNGWWPYAVLMLWNLTSAFAAEKLNFSPIFSQQLAFCFCFWNLNCYGGRRTRIAQLPP